MLMKQQYTSMLIVYPRRWKEECDGTGVEQWKVGNESAYSLRGCLQNKAIAKPVCVCCVEFQSIDTIRHNK